MNFFYLGTGDIPGSNPGKGENFLMKIRRSSPALVAQGVMGQQCSQRNVICNVCVMMTEI